MITCDVCPLEAAPSLDFTVVFSRHGDGWLFSRHRARDTWETQGGHIEPGETPERAAVRELYEESGAVPASCVPVCAYWTARDGGAKRYGAVYLAEIQRLDPMPNSEMAEVRHFEALPGALTYPDITPKLFEAVCAYRKARRTGEA